MALKWVEALKKYNEGKKYSIPKKGTPEYAEVLKIMGKDVPAAPPAAPAAKAMDGAEKPKRGRKAAAKAAAVEEPDMKAEKPAAPAEKPKRKPRAPRVKKIEVDVSSNAADAKPEPPRKRKAKAGSVPAGMIPEGMTKKAVQASKNPEAVLESATNAHMPIVPAEAMVGLKGIKATKKHLRAVQNPVLPTLVDKERVVNEVPFSFSALRNHLGC
jgi:hypothetical protein